MNHTTLLIILLVYFLFLYLLSRLTSSRADSDTFFLANRNSPWWLVSIGMVGASLSAVTFISLPGVVGAGGLNQQFSYMQMALGYVAGYHTVAYILLPLYYRLNLTSIYEYIGQRFGISSQKVASVSFIISRGVSGALRFYLILSIFHNFLFQHLGIPFFVSSAAMVLFVWLYTRRGGLKTVVLTDAIQTVIFLISLIVTILYLMNALDLSIADIGGVFRENNLSKLFFFEGGWASPNNFFKQFISGFFIVVVMTGLDQDIMQKNLTCKNLKEARRNMVSVGYIFLPVSFLFLVLGGLMVLYMNNFGIEVPLKDLGGELTKSYDMIYPTLAFNNFAPYIGILFFLGVTAAACSSIDSVLTSVATSISKDILQIDDLSKLTIKRRNTIYALVVLSTYLIMLFFGYYSKGSLINTIFKLTGYTYGPLLGMFAFGLFTKKKTVDAHSIVIAILSPILTYVFTLYSDVLLFGYKPGFEILLWNALFTYLMLMLSSTFRTSKLD